MLSRPRFWWGICARNCLDFRARGKFRYSDFHTDVVPPLVLMGDFSLEKPRTRNWTWNWKYVDRGIVPGIWIERCEIPCVAWKFFLRSIDSLDFFTCANDFEINLLEFLYFYRSFGSTHLYLRWWIICPGPAKGPSYCLSFGLRIKGYSLSLISFDP